MVSGTVHNNSPIYDLSIQEKTKKFELEFDSLIPSSSAATISLVWIRAPTESESDSIRFEDSIRETATNRIESEMDSIRDSIRGSAIRFEIRGFDLYVRPHHSSGLFGQGNFK